MPTFQSIDTTSNTNHRLSSISLPDLNLSDSLRTRKRMGEIKGETYLFSQVEIFLGRAHQGHGKTSPKTGV